MAGIRLRGTLVLSSVALASLGGPLSAAEGMRLIGTGPAQMGTAGGGIASPQDSTWMSLNPASLVEIKERADLGEDTLQPEPRLTPQGAIGNTAAGTMHDTTLVTVPTATYATPYAGGVAGFGVYSIGGLALDYPQARSIFGAGGGFDHRVEASVLRAAAVYGRTLYDGWAVGLSLNLDYQELRSDSITGSGAETSGRYDRDHAFGGGFQLGVHKRWDTLAFGASYTSRQWMQRFDRYADLIESTLDQPQVFQTGIAWRVTSWLEPLVDYRFINWTQVKAFGDHSAGFGWKNQHIIKLGCNAYPAAGLVLRAGLSYGRSPIDASTAFVNGLTPLITELHATIGVGWDFAAHYTATLAYMHGFKKSFTDDGSDAGGAGQGTRIELTIDSLAAGLSYQF